MKISDIEKKTGLSRDTIRYYEKIQLVRSFSKNSSGVKIYGPKALKEINFITKAKELGFSLEEIRHGIDQYFQKGKLCQDILSSINEKKIFFETRRNEDLITLKKIDAFLKTLS